LACRRRRPSRADSRSCDAWQRAQRHRSADSGLGVRSARQRRCPQRPVAASPLDLGPVNREWSSGLRKSGARAGSAPPHGDVRRIRAYSPNRRRTFRSVATYHAFWRQGAKQVRTRSKDAASEPAHDRSPRIAAFTDRAATLLRTANDPARFHPGGPRSGTPPFLRGGAIGLEIPSAPNDSGCGHLDSRLGPAASG